MSNEKRNNVSKNDLPDNLFDSTWAGSLTGKIFSKYKDLVIVYGVITFILGIGVGFGSWFAMEKIWPENPFYFEILGLIFWMWSFLGIFVIYQLWLTRIVYLFEPDSSEIKWKLNRAKWFKRDAGKFKLTEGVYDEKGRRTLFFIFNKKEGKYYSFKPFEDVNVSNAYGNSEDNTKLPSPAEMAGLISWYDTVKTYAYTKSISLQQAIQYGVFAIIVIAELLGIMFLSGKLNGS